MKIQSCFPLLHAVLPLPPGINHSYQIVLVRTPRGPRHRLAASTKLTRFKRNAEVDLLTALIDWEKIEQVRTRKQPLSATLCFFHPDARRRDVDGNIKAILDAAFTHMKLDDNLITRLHAAKEIDRENPRCEIVVEAIDEPVQ